MGASRRDRALSPLRSDRAACGVSSLPGDDRSRGRAGLGPHEAAGVAGEDLRSEGKGARRPLSPATAIGRAVARLRLRPHHPGGFPLPPSLPAVRHDGRADGRGHRPAAMKGRQ